MPLSPLGPRTDALFPAHQPWPGMGGNFRRIMHLVEEADEVISVVEENDDRKNQIIYPLICFSQSRRVLLMSCPQDFVELYVVLKDILSQRDYI